MARTRNEMMHEKYFFISSRRRHTRYIGDWSSDVCSSDLDRRRKHGHAGAHHQPGRHHDDHRWGYGGHDGRREHRNPARGADLATDDDRQPRARRRGRPETALDEHGRHDSDRVRWTNAHGDRWRTASLEARHPNELVGSGPLGPSLAQGSLRKEAPFVYAQTFRRAAVPRVLDRTGRPRTGRPAPDRLRHRALPLVLAAVSESHRVLH